MNQLADFNKVNIRTIRRNDELRRALKKIKDETDLTAEEVLATLKEKYPEKFI